MRRILSLALFVAALSFASVNCTQIVRSAEISTAVSTTHEVITDFKAGVSFNLENTSGTYNANDSVSFSPGDTALRVSKGITLNTGWGTSATGGFVVDGSNAATETAQGWEFAWERGISLSGAASNTDIYGFTFLSHSGQGFQGTVIGDAITVSSGKNAYGIAVENLSGGSITVGDISATGNTSAYGIQLERVSSASKLSFGDIEAKSTNGNAYGISIDGTFNNYLNRSHPGDADTAKGLRISSEISASSENASAFAVYAGGTGGGSNLITLETGAVLKAEGDANSASISLEQASGNNRNRLVFDINGAWNNDGSDFIAKNLTDVNIARGNIHLNNSLELVRNGNNQSTNFTVEKRASLVLDSRLGGDDTKSVADDLVLKVDRFDLLDGAKLDAINALDMKNPFAGGTRQIASTILEGDLHAAHGSEITFRAAKIAGSGESFTNVGLFVDGDIVLSAAPTGGTHRTVLNVLVDRNAGESGYMQVASGFWLGSDGTETQGLTLANRSFANNAFYTFQAVNYVDDGNYESETAHILISKRTRADVLELYPAALSLHDHLSVHKSVSSMIAKKFLSCRSRPVSHSHSHPSYHPHPHPDSYTISPQAPGRYRDIWINWVGSSNNHLRSEYTARKMKVHSNGLQLGYNFATRKDRVLGIMFGYEDRELDGNDGFGSHLDARDYYFGVYGSKMLGNGWDVLALGGYGRQQYEMQRNGNYGVIGSIFRGADFDGNTAEATLEFGRRCFLQCNTSFRPVIGLDYFTVDADAARETGPLPLRFQDSDLTQLFLRVGSDLQWDNGWINVHGGMYFSQQLLGDGDFASTQVFDPLQGGVSLPVYYDMGNSIFTFNIGASYMLPQCPRLMLYGDYTGDFHVDRPGGAALHTGSFGFRWSF